MPSSASAPASPTSASHSQNSATQPSPRKNLAEAANSNDAEEKKPDLTDQFDEEDETSSSSSFICQFLRMLPYGDLESAYCIYHQLDFLFSEIWEGDNLVVNFSFSQLPEALGRTHGLHSPLSLTLWRDVTDFYNFNSIEKYQKYEADYAQRLMAKYFSKKNLYGGNIFEENTTVDNEIIKSSKWPCTRSFADPLQGFEDHRSSCSTSAMESHSAISNGKHAVKKNG
uniref:Uncharacterized protein n=1 Tax=Cucumis melo TaxID=3656 RepID=A0A9I9DE16_CUCME